MAIAFMRHGQTDWNLNGRVQGHTDIPLNETGRGQALAAAEALALAGDTWSHITSSPLGRARETASIIAGHLGVDLADPLPGLIEQNYGEAEGSSTAELGERWPTREFKHGELPEQVATRALETLNHLGNTHGENRVLAVTHGAYIRRLIATINAVEYLAVPSILNATITLFDRKADGEWIVTMINDEHTLPQLVTFGDAGAGFCTTDGVCT